MANEENIAALTDRIAQTMYRTRATLDNVAESLSRPEFDTVLRRRLEDIETLAGTAGRVSGVEQEAERLGAIATRSQDHGDMERWSDADVQVRRTFGYSQAEAGDLASRIGAAQRQLGEFRGDLAVSSTNLDQALKDVDTLETFPEYGKSDTSEGLRTRLTKLKSLATNADTGLENAVARLDTARTTASQFERSSLEAGQGRHSSAVRDASASLAGTVTQTREGLTEVREGIDANLPDATSMADYGVAEATRAAELANAMRAGMTPRPQSAQAGNRAEGQDGNGVQDPRLRLMRPAQDNSLDK